MLPLTGFLFYFTYFYQTLTFWALLLSTCVWMLATKITGIGTEYFTFNRKHLLARIMRLTRLAAYYLTPFCTLVWAAVKFSDKGLPILLGFLWYVGIAAHYLSERIHRYNIDIDRIEGRFRKLKKAIYQTAAQIPVIGYKPKPFKALNAVPWISTPACSAYWDPTGQEKPP